MIASTQNVSDLVRPLGTLIWVGMLATTVVVAVIRVRRMGRARTDGITAAAALLALIPTVLMASALAGPSGDAVLSAQADRPPVPPALLVAPTEALTLDADVTVRFAPAKEQGHTPLLAVGQLSVRQTNDRLVADAPPWGTGLDLGPVPEDTYDLRLLMEDNRSLRIWVDGTLTRVQMRYDLPGFATLAGQGVAVNPQQAVTAHAQVTVAAKPPNARLLTLSLLIALLLALYLGAWTVGRLHVVSRDDRATPSMARRIGQIVAGGWAIALLVFVWRLQDGPSAVPYSPAYNQPFGPRAPRFSDFFQTLFLSRSGNPYERARSIYPPGSWLSLKPLSVMGDQAAFVVFFGLVLGAIVCLCWKYARASGATAWMMIATVGSFPMLFALDRGNTELLPFALCLVAATLTITGRRARGSGALVGLAAAMKLWPVFLLAALHRRFGWRSTLAGMVTGIGWTLLAAGLMAGGPVTSVKQWLGVLGGEPVLSATDPASACGVANNFGAFGTSWSTLSLSLLNLLGCHGDHSSGWAQQAIAAVTAWAVPVAVLLFVMLTLMLNSWRTQTDLALAVMFAAIAALPYPSFAYRNIYLVAAAMLVAVRVPDLRRPAAVAVALGLSLVPANLFAFTAVPGSLLTMAALITPVAGLTTAVLLVAEARSRRYQGLAIPERPSLDASQESAASRDPSV